MGQRVSEEAPAEPGAAAENRVCGWVEAMGLRMQVCAAGDSTSAKVLEDMLRPWCESGGPVMEELDGSEAPAELSVDMSRLTEESAERAASQLSTRITLAGLEHHSGAQLLFHAGGIAHGDGQVAAIVGPSGRGKTTTIRHLAQTYGYVSDETVVITEGNGVLPYRKPLSVITEGHTHKLQLPPAQLGLQPLPEAPLTLAALVVLERRDDGVEESVVEPASLGPALIELVQQTSYLAELPHPLRRIAEVAEETGGIRTLRVGVPERIAEAAPQLFTPGACEEWRQVLPEAGTGGAAGRVPFVPAEVLDAIECEGGTVVFSPDKNIRLLSGVGSVLWAGLCEGDDWPALQERVVEAVGEPPEGETGAAITEACEALVDAGVLLRA